MKKLFIGSLLLSALGITTLAFGDDDEHEGFMGRWFNQHSLDVAPVRNEQYQSECASCHFAYQPGLLPARSWKQIMAGLDDHFGDNAELAPEEHKAILNYLVDNAADSSNYKRSKRIAGSLKKDEVPLRITDTLYFKRKHHEIPERFVRGNSEVGSYSNCAACHTRAESGSYDEHQVRIPGVGRWDD